MNDDEGFITRTTMTKMTEEDDDEDAADDDSLLSPLFASSMSIVIYLLWGADWFNRLKTISTRQMLLIKRCDELCVKRGKQDWKKSFECQISIFDLRAWCSVVDSDFSILCFALNSWFRMSSRAFMNWRKHSWLPKKAPKCSKNELYSSNISKTAMVTW